MNMSKKIWIYTGIITGAFFISLAYGYLMGSFGVFGGDSGFYVKSAQGILSTGLQYYIDHAAHPYYWGYPTFLALCMAIFGENWLAVALLQTILSAVGMLFLYRVVEDIVENSAIAVIMTLFYKLILDTSMWDGRILSDSLAMTLECMTLYFFYVGMKDKKKRDYVLFVVFAVLFFMTRTNASALLVVLSIAMLKRVSGKKEWIIIGVIAAITITGLLVVGAKNNFFDIGRVAGVYADRFRHGDIVYGRPEYNYAVPEGHIGTPLFVLDMIWMLLSRAKYYWSIFFGAYSTVHIILCFLTILPIFLLTLFSAICIIRNKKRQLYPYVAGIVSYSLFNIFTEVDFDQRYRAPIFLLCIICSAYGVKKIYISPRLQSVFGKDRK